MGSKLQLNLRGISISNHLLMQSNQTDPHYKLTNTLPDFFAKVLSAIDNFFQYLITLFNKELPPETRDDQINHWFHVATPYLIGAAVLITLLCCCPCLVSCLLAIIRGLFSFLYGIFAGFFKAVVSVFRCLCCCGRRSGVRMMIAPGRAPTRLPRDLFEADPRGYFRNLRGQPSNFVF